MSTNPLRLSKALLPRWPEAISEGPAPQDHLNLVIDVGNLFIQPVESYPGDELPAVEVRHASRALERQGDEKLTYFLDTNDGLFGQRSPLAADQKRLGLQRLEELCIELVRADFAFLDGYAHLVSARVALGKPKAAIEAGQPARCRTPVSFTLGSQQAGVR